MRHFLIVCNLLLIILSTGYDAADAWVSDDRCTATEIPFSDAMAAISGTEGSDAQLPAIRALVELISEDNELAYFEEDCLRELAQLDGSTIMAYYYMSKRYADISSIDDESKALINNYLASKK